MLRFLREGLRRPLTEPRPEADPEFAALATSLNETAQRRLGHSLAIRQVDAGSCNGCELEIHALNNAFYDIERFGIHFVASPRHADVLLVTLWSAPGARHPIRNGSWRSAIVVRTAAYSPRVRRSSVACRRWFRWTW